MGTNYYLAYNNSEVNEVHVGLINYEYHIGKSSYGWNFSLHVMPEKGIFDLDDWRLLWANHKIVDEYNDFVSVGEMERIITMRMGKVRISKYKYSVERGLFRHSVDGTYCIGHGNGTWDLMIGIFS